MSSTAKTAYVETGITIGAPIYSTEGQTTITAPQALTLTKVGQASEEGVYRGILISWARPAFGAAISYSVHWRKDDGNYTTINDITGVSHEIPTTSAGTYTVLVYANGLGNTRSPAASASTTINLDSGVGSSLNPVTTLTVAGGGTTFVGSDLNVVFTNPTTNDNVSAILKDFKVDVYDTSTLLRTEYVGAGTQPGDTVNYFYDFSKNVADGGPRRTVRIVVSARDTENKVSTGNDVTFTNPAPAVLSNVSVSGGIGSVKITYTRPTDSDFAGVLIWASQTTGFPLNDATLVYDGADSYVSLTALTAGETWYYKLAAYDTFFARNYTGSGLNITGQFTTTTLAVDAGMPRYATAPAGVQGDVYYNTTDNHLYQHNGTAWVLVSSDITANSITGAMITTNSISSNHILANAVTADKIVANTITGDRIAANTITADRMTVTTLSSVVADLGTITAGTITLPNGGHIKSGQSAYNTGTGFYIGNDGNVPVFSLGTNGGAGILWDGTSLTINGGGTFSGALSAATGSFAGSLSAASGTLGVLTINAGGNIKMGQSSYNNGSGFFLGQEGGVIKFSIGTSINSLLWDGTKLTVKGTIVPVLAAGDVVLLSAPTLRSIPNVASFSMYKAFSIFGAGVVRVKYRLSFSKNFGTNGACYGRIYINGSYAGFENAVGSSAAGTYTADVVRDVTIAANDIVQIWCYASGTTYTGASISLASISVTQQSLSSNSVGLD